MLFKILICCREKVIIQRDASFVLLLDLFRILTTWLCKHQKCFEGQFRKHYEKDGEGSVFTLFVSSPQGNCLVI